MPENVVKFVQISDTHVFSDHNKQLLGVNTQDSLDAVIKMLAQIKDQYNFLVHSGDLSQDNAVASYQKVIAGLSILEKPIYAIAGNHDDAEVMEKALLSAAHWHADKQLVFDHWQLILLNTQKAQSVSGCLNDKQLSHLTTCLTQYPEKHAAIILHHHPLFVGTAWLDKLGLENATQFWQIITNHASVKAVFFGHVHQEHASVLNNVFCYSVPSTCIQFKRRHDAFALEELTPGFRLVALHENGTVSTEVKRLDHYVGYFDADATGY